MIVHTQYDCCVPHLSVIFVGNGVSEEVNSPHGVGNLWLFAEEKNVANQSSANMDFSNTLRWNFEMIHVCKNPRGGGGGFHFLAHGLNLTITELLKALIYQVRHLHSE